MSTFYATDVQGPVTLALLGVVLAGLYFVVLAVVAFSAPEKAERFLLGFAGTPCAHFLEMALRLAIGVAFVIRSPLMMFPEAFKLFGWVLVVTTACLLVVPWRWHRQFAQRVVPQALRRLRLVAMGSLALGALVLASAVWPAR